jgi:pimeloyl-ACP methyl ester carboxylesterase
MLQVQAAVDGVHSTFILDTGDRSQLTLFERFARAQGFYGVTPLQQNVVTGYGIGGPIRSNVIGAHLDAFGFHMSDIVTRIPLGNAGVFSSEMRAGSIGNGVLLRFNTVYDRVAHTLTLWPSNNFSRPAIADPPAVLRRHGVFGAVLADKPAGATITRVLPQSAAAGAGMQPGDVIAAINGAAVSNTAAVLASLHRLHAGDRATITILRAGSKHDHRVVLGAPPDESDPLVTTLYDSVNVDGTLRRTLLTLPKDANSRLPAVLVLGGIGCYTIDAAANPQDAYMRLTHDLTRAGFVTMRIEKSGVGDSQGPPCPSVDFAAEERGYAAALDALRSNPHVDPSRVYLFGHSIGSIEAAQLALTQPVAGVIITGAVGRDWPEYEVRNLRRQLELTGTSPSQTDAALIFKQSCMVRLLIEKQSESEIERSVPGCKDPNGVYPVAAPYMQQVAAVNIIDLWSKIGVPVLAIHGASDFVTEDEDHQRIAQVVNVRHPGSAAYVSISGMDHLLFRASSPKAAYDAFASNTPREYDADLSRVVLDWLERQTTP